MITLTPNAVKAINRFIRTSEKPVAGLRILIQGGGCSGFQYGLRLEEEQQMDDTELLIDGVKVLVDPISYSMLGGLTVDFIETLTHTGFKFDNPNATSKCSCGSSFSV
ncbi:MAG: iron-sulfur cluster assembly accessory protein [Rhodocyclaceae bacterium]|nr:iron-sulfur cluster assembly accessory protein [Rhodocyclaceae bacterium]